MSKNFIYFFKHKKVAGVKIGRTSGDSINQRFTAFKTYSPYGAEILGFFECENCILKEVELHKRFRMVRMSGEFFNITEDMVRSIVSENEFSLNKINQVFNEWASNPENNVDKLKSILSDINKKENKEPILTVDQKMILSKIEPATSNENDGFLTIQDICKYVGLNYKKNASSRIFTNIGFIVSVKRVNSIETKKGFFYKNI
jgi:hypothetical protein